MSHLSLQLARVLRMGLCLTLACVAAASAADVYRWVDEQGNAVFSDTPQPGAEKIELKETTVVPAETIIRPSTRLSPADSEPKPFTGYSAVQITAPAAEETVRNVRTVTVEVSVEPGLRGDDGHLLQLYFDGEPYGAPTKSTSFIINDLVRGEHQLAAAVLDRAGTVLKRSETTVFFVQLHSIQH